MEGLLYDVNNNNFWLNSLGEKPTNMKEANRLIIEACNKAPKLIPIYGHRYMSAVLNSESIPVLSVYQTDIIYYGSDLENYLNNEFVNPKQHILTNITPIHIPFWSEIINAV